MWHAKEIIGLFVLLSVAGCQPQVRRTCPTDRLSCDCFELESQQPTEEVAALIERLTDLSNPSLQGPITAASDLEQMCRGEEGWRPPREGGDGQWRVRCSAAELAMPALLRTFEALESRRTVTGDSRPQEDTLAVSLVSALGNIALGNPDSRCHGDAVVALIAALEASEATQDMRVNFTALRLLGPLGDDRAIPALTRAVFRRGRERRLDLMPPALVALQRIENLEAAAAALVVAGRGGETAEIPEGERQMVPREVKGRVAHALGQLGVANAEVTGYLMEELRQTELAHRRQVAARALGRLGHQPALEVILPRLALTEEGASVDGSVDISEVPGYLVALGEMLAPSRTEEALLLWLRRGDPTLKDIAGRHLALQGSTELAEALEAASAQMPACAAGARGCLRNNFEQRYVPALRSAAACTDLECWTERLADREGSSFSRQRAAIQLALHARTPAEAQSARQALVSAIEAQASEGGEELEVLIFALDRLSPEGCPEACLDRLTAVVVQRRDEPETHEERLVGALAARLRARADGR